MVPVLTLTIGSGTILACLVLLFRKEVAQGERVVLTEFRSRFDYTVTQFCRILESVFGHVRAGVFRATFHFILHQILGVVIGGLTRIQRKLYELHERQIRISKTVTHERKTHLDEIAAHKEETALDESEKRKLKSHV